MRIYFARPDEKNRRFVSYGDIAQLARAPALQAGGPGFESLCLHQRKSTMCTWCFFFGFTTLCGVYCPTLTEGEEALGTKEQEADEDGKGGKPVPALLGSSCCCVTDSCAGWLRSGAS